MGIYVENYPWRVETWAENGSQRDIHGAVIYEIKVTVTVIVMPILGVIFWWVVDGVRRLS